MDKLSVNLDHLYERLSGQSTLTTLEWFADRASSVITGIPIISYCQVTRMVFVGPQHGYFGKQRLMAMGIRACVNMRMEFDDASHCLALPYYCHIPTLDESTPSLEQLFKAITFIQEILQQGESVYIHCRNGMGRAPTMTAAYLMSQGVTLANAIDMVRRARPFIRISTAQMMQLTQLQTLFGNDRS